nr:MAG TPA: hypothetical protein [Bacteriophage sp.]
MVCWWRWRWSCSGLYCVNLNNTTQKASAGAFNGVFFTGRWWPFFIYRRKKYV